MRFLIEGHSGTCYRRGRGGKRQPRGAEERGEPRKVIVEHTSINPNKAAHIGHVRNAVLGDTIARILRDAGERVQVQNYIDNTGVQVADVVIGFLQMEKKSRRLKCGAWRRSRASIICAGICTRKVNAVLRRGQGASGAALRGATLKAIEEGHGEAAEMGADRRRRDCRISLADHDAPGHFLRTAGARERNSAFEILGCGVCEAERSRGDSAGDQPGRWRAAGSCRRKKTVNEAPRAEVTEQDEDEENIQDKIIVRSNGTVTYVGKDIAYQLWKFGLLGKDFHYKRWLDAPVGRDGLDHHDGCG